MLRLDAITTYTKPFSANAGSRATPIMPLCPWHTKSSATSAEPLVPKRRVVVPSGRRTESPRQRSVKNSVPSAVKARSQGLDSPVAITVRCSTGARVPPGTVSMGVGSGGVTGTSVPPEQAAARASRSRVSVRMANVTPLGSVRSPCPRDRAFGGQGGARRPSTSAMNGSITRFRSATGIW